MPSSVSVLRPQTCKVTWKSSTQCENLCKSLFFCLRVEGWKAGREGGRALVRRSCSCVNHVGPYASFLRRAHASEIDRQPSLARSGVGRGRARSQPRTCHNQRRAASGGEGVEGCGGGGGLCVTPQLFRRILRVTSTSSRLQNITLITSNAGASPLRLEEFCPNLSLISAIRMHALFQGWNHTYRCFLFHRNLSGFFFFFKHFTVWQFWEGGDELMRDNRAVVGQGCCAKAGEGLVSCLHHPKRTSQLPRRR